MREPTPLYIVFTLDCQPAGTSKAPEGPRRWEQSSRSIDAYCAALHAAGYPVTLFLTPGCADMHAPFIEELAAGAVELALYVQPQSLQGGYKRYFGQYDGEQQRDIVVAATSAFQDVIGRRPLSVRTDMFSANDATFAVLASLGFQQGSVSSPGRKVTKHAAVWVGAERDAHYASVDNRLAAGSLPFLEVPVTTDADQLHGGISPALTLDAGTFQAWHRPLIEGQLQRMELEATPFRSLCVQARNSAGFHEPKDRARVALDEMIAYFRTLSEPFGGRTAYAVRPVTLAGAHMHYRSAPESRRDG